MITRTPRALVAVFLTALVVFSAAACQRVPLLAPTGSTITLTTTASALPVNGTADLIAQVIEAAGTPPHSGTHVSFTTSLGTIEPSETETDINGRAQVKFLAGNVNGVATITASSGNAQGAAAPAAPASGSSGTTTTASTSTGASRTIAIGTAAVGHVTVSASPATVPSTGGTTTISASVLDINGNVLSLVPVNFSTTAGTLSTAVATTDSNGVATASLMTGQQATVTAVVGVPPTSTGSGSGNTAPTGPNIGTVTVNVDVAPTVVITPPTSPAAGLPAVFKIVVTVAAGGNGAPGGAAVRNLLVSWGDGQSQDLGAVTGEANVAHVYTFPGTYAVRATVTDASGNTSSVSTAVTVIPVPRPTIVVTPTPQSAPGGTTITFTIEITVPTGVAIQNVVINFDDGATQNLGGFSGRLTLTHPYAAGVRTYNVTVDVTDSTGTTTRGSATVSITT